MTSFLMQISVANGGTMEFAQRGEVLKHISNSVKSTGNAKNFVLSRRILIVFVPLIWSDFSVKTNISYFFGVDASESYRAHDVRWRQ